MPDQADHLRQLVQQTRESDEHAAPPPVVVVSGGKLGVGTTTLAFQLARSLATQRRSVIFVDADLRRPDATSRLGLDHSGSHTLADILEGRRIISEVLRTGSTGFLVLAAGGPALPAPEFGGRARQRLAASLRSLSQRVDFVVVDAGTGLTPWSQWWWQVARVVLAVTTTDDIAVMDTYAMLKIAAHGDGDALRRVSVVVNRCECETDAENAHRRLALACFRFLGELVPAEQFLPSDDTIGCAAPATHLSRTSPATAYASAITQLATNLVRRMEIAADQGRAAA